MEMYVSLEEAGEQMGLSGRTVRRMVEDGELTAFKFRRSLRVSVQSIAAYVAECKVESASK